MNRPTDSVRIVLFDIDIPDEFLVLTESDDSDNWKLPGGKFDTADESPADAAKRELAEELGLGAEEVELHAAQRLVNDDGISARHIFAAKTPRIQVIPSREIAATRWVNESTVPEGKNKSHILSAVQTARLAMQEYS